MAKVAYLGLKIVLLCLLWYVTSAANNVVGKLVLQSFPYPTTVTLVQFLSITIYSIPILRYIPGAKRSTTNLITWSYYFKLIIPLAFGKFFASLTSHISLWAVPVSYAHTIKASMPLFVVVLSRVILGEKQTTKVYLSLIPIILGVFIASVTELEFNFTGLIAALFSIFIFSLQNIYSKKVLKETPIHHLRLLYILAKHALLMFIPFWIYNDLFKILNADRSSSAIDGWTISGFLFLDGLCNFLQNVIAFTMLSLVTPLTYSVCNASKRIAVISCSILLLKNPVTPVNIFGMSLAIFGVFYYNKAKLDSRNEDMKNSILPIVNTNNHIAKKHDMIGIPVKTTTTVNPNNNLLLRYINIDNNQYEQQESNSFPKPIIRSLNKSRNGFIGGFNNNDGSGGDYRKIDMVHI